MDKILKTLIAFTLAVTSFATPVLALAPGGELSASKKAELQSKIQEIKAKSQEKITELKSKAEVRTAEVKTKACEARKTNLATRLNNRTEAAKRHKNKFDEIKNRVDDYATNKSLKSDTADQLNTKAVAVATAANEEITTLENLDIAIDCSKTDDLAVKLDAYKSEVNKVKESLKNYREAIRLYAQEVKKLSVSGEGI